MDNLAFGAQLLSMISFLVYGASCLTTRKMDLEFKRYGLIHLKTLTGSLQIAGSLGIAAGFFFPYLTALASLGLTLMMFVACVVRARLNDSLFQRIPAFFFFLVNLFILYSSLSRYY
jgi:hypothetical protein